MADYEIQGVETRSRSRSKTPLRVMETRQGTKIPNVQTIAEEEVETIVTPVLRTSTRIKDVVKDNRAETSTKRVTEETLVTSTTTVVTSTAKKETNNKLDTPKKMTARVTTRKSKEMTDNDKNALLETSIEAIRKSTSSENLTNGNGTGNNIAYLVYKEAGEYWNKFPKTDYTYSELSPHRRELAPGQFIMPNMSRGSLDKHHARIENMIQKSPEQAAYIRERYQARTTTRASIHPKVQYDSGDELDYSEYETRQTAANTSNYEYTSTTITTRFKRVVTTIITTIYTYFISLFNLSSANMNKTESLYYTRFEERRGFFARVINLLTTVWLAVLRRFYVAISSILTIDTWLLMSRSSSLMGQRKRRFLLLLLFLLPLLLLGGFLFYHDPEFLAFVKNSIHAWQQSILDLGRIVVSKVNATFLAIYGAVNFSEIYDTVVPVVESSKVVLQEFTKYCVDVYQSTTAFICDIWNENFNSAAVSGGSTN